MTTVVKRYRNTAFIHTLAWIGWYRFIINTEVKLEFTENRECYARRSYLLYQAAPRCELTAKDKKRRDQLSRQLQRPTVLSPTEVRNAWCDAWLATDRPEDETHTDEREGVWRAICGERALTAGPGLPSAMAYMLSTQDQHQLSKSASPCDPRSVLSPYITH